MLEQAKYEYYCNSNKIKLGYGIEVPKRILRYKFPRMPIDIEKLRNDRLNNPSPPEVSFHNYYPEALKEAPFIITNRSLLTSLNDHCNLPYNSPDRDKNLHLVDFYIPDALLGIELDSQFHTGREIEDMIRDKYLWFQFGITILRYNGEDFKNHLDEINYYKSLKKSPIKINYQQQSDEYFDFIYSDEIRIFMVICGYDNNIINPRLKKIILTTKDINYLSLRSENIKKLRSFLDKCLKKKLYILNIDVRINDLVKYYKKPGITQDQIYNTLKQLGYL